MTSPRYPCACCGHLTMDDGPGSHEICPVCFWQDDPTQLRWPDSAGGANRPALIEAQRNFSRFGAKEERFVDLVREARDDEPRDPAWRAVDPARDRFEPAGVRLAAWPEDRTVLYWWRYRDAGFWWAGGGVRPDP